MSISFGAKIPRAVCNIYDKNNMKFVPATLYELECTEKSDIDYVRNLDGKWKFQKSIALLMNDKYNANNNPSYRRYLNELLQRNSISKYYSLESSNGDVACLCCTDSVENDVDIIFIESNPAKNYKYAASSMMAAIAKSLLGTKKNLTVKAPLTEVRPFYAKVCGFKTMVDKYYRGFELPQSEIEPFIRMIEEKTSGKILNYSC